MTRSPTLLWINHFAIASGEGGGTRHFELGRALASRGWRVTIGASDFHLHARQYTRRIDVSDRSAIVEQVDGVEFRWLWSMPYAGNDWRRLANWVSFGYSVTRLGVRELPADVVIGSSPHLFAALAAERLARRLRVPFVLEVRDLWPESLQAVGGRKGPFYHLLQRIASYLYRRADRIIVLASGVGAYLSGRGVDPLKIVEIPNGADVSAFQTVERPTRDSFTCIYAGAHGSANGLGAVIEAADLLRQNAHIRFLLVGDGPEKQRLIEMARARGLDNVEFQAPVPKAGIPELLLQADAGLMVLRDAPLFSYGVSPNKLFDYLAAGLPVICNVPGEVEAIVREAGAGVQTPDSSGRALAESVLRMADRPAVDRERIGRSGRAWMSRHRDRAVLADRLDQILKDLLQ